MTETVHLAIYDTLADWEIGHAVAHIRNPNWQRRPGRYDVKTVARTADPIRTMGGLTIVPDLLLADLTPADSAMLILPGNDIWPTEEYRAWTDATREFLAADIPVAAICGATGALALAGLLDDREHTSNAREFLDGLGYAGGALFRDEPAVTDRNLITGRAQAPVEFAKAILARLDVYEPAVLESWFTLYGRQDPSGFYELMAVG